ncbi:hypothetical protein [Mycobacterium sp. C31M]
MTLPLLMIACATVSACGVRFEAIAAPPPLPAPSAMPFVTAEQASLIFTPCIREGARSHAVSEISNRLLGKDPFAVDCGHRANVVARPEPVPNPHINADMVVTDELVSAVLTGTGEYWHQPVIGPA